MSLKKLVFMLFLFLNSTLLLAAVNECPSVDFIREKAHFTSAHTYLEKNYWVLTTDIFQLNGKKWNLMFVAHLIETDAMKALAAGQQLFDSQVKVNAPELEPNGDQLYCVYTHADHYALAAVSPPTIFVD